MPVDRKAQKRSQLAALIQQVYAQIDDWRTTDIPAIQTEIDTLVAVANRTAVQNVDLRALRRDLKIVRFALRLGRVVLLVAGQARDEDINGND
jgi:predicted dinucleotide-utilizing enzyme